MFADFRINGFPLMKSATTLSKIILRVHGKAQPQNNHRLQRIGLPGQRRTPNPLMEPVPLYRGMHKLADPNRESNGIFLGFRSLIFHSQDSPVQWLTKLRGNAVIVYHKNWRTQNPHFGNGLICFRYSLARVKS